MFLFIFPIIIIGFYVLSIIYHTHLWFISTYGVLTLTNYIAQTFFAYLNRMRCNNMPVIEDETSALSVKTANIHVVGFREDEEYFKNCLESCRDTVYPGLKYIIICIDGNDLVEDCYMADIANKVFPDCFNVNLHRLPNEFTDKAEMREYLEKKIVDKVLQSNAKVICITQPHFSKRGVLYTAMQLSNLLNVDLFMNTDSDTIIDKDCLYHLVRRFQSEAHIGGVGGEVCLFNANENWLTKLSSVRYYLAFNIERSAQSLFGVVSCLSGPNLLLDTKLAMMTIEEFINHAFMGVLVSKGDDRYLTHLILSLGYKVVYTHKAIVYSETPSSYSRFAMQQKRWQISSIIGLSYSAAIVDKHHIYMTWEIIFQILFPMLITTTLLVSLYSKPWQQSLRILIAIFSLPFFRVTCVQLFFEWKPEIYYYMFYPLIYISTLLPIKFIALFELKSDSWGTSDRRNLVSKKLEGYFPMITFLLIMIIGTIYHIVEHYG
jgi:hyaluronan synthase